MRGDECLSPGFYPGRFAAGSRSMTIPTYTIEMRGGGVGGAQISGSRPCCIVHRYRYQDPDAHCEITGFQLTQ
jgi:hypothetical protein